MKSLIRLFMVVTTLLISAHRLPAPIQEVPESPTPAPEENAKPRRSTKVKTTSASAPTPAKTPATPFVGIWTGTLNFGLLGATEDALTINSTGTIVFEKNHFGTATHPATWDGRTVTFRGGALNEINFTVTPNPDGKTAIVTANSLFISNPSATFTKTPNSESIADSSIPTSSAGQAQKITPPTGDTRQPQIPTAKPVSDKPGFVYDPFDPSSKMLIDVRGRPSGAKVKDPKGRLFIVP